MYKLFSMGDKIAYGIKGFIFDNPTYLQTQNPSGMGDIAFVISTSTLYIANSKPEWVQVKIPVWAGGNDDGSADDETTEDILTTGVLGSAVIGKLILGKFKLEEEG